MRRPPTNRFRPEALLAAVEPRLAKALVPRAAFRVVREIASALPPVALTLGLECRLVGDGPIDFGASVSPANGGAGILAGRARDEIVLRAARGDARWRRLRAFAKDWTAPRSRLARRVPFVFLEFDAGAPPHPPLRGDLSPRGRGGERGRGEKGVPVPSVFLGLDWLVEELGGGGRARTGFRDVIGSAQKLRGKRFAARTKALAVRCFEVLPARGVLLHVAVMVARPGQDLRYSVLVPRSQVERYLREIGRGECAPSVGQVIERYAPVGGFPHAADHVQLDFDVGGGDERIGVTLNPPKAELWRKLLEDLVRGKLAEPAKAEALLAWPGVSVGELGDSLPSCLVVRWLWHVKVVCTPAGVAGAKVYFGMRPVWSPRR